MASSENKRPGANVHADIIAGILSDFPAAKTKGFMRALRDIPEAEYTRAMHTDFPKWWRNVSFIPDAFMVDDEAREVIVFEAVHHHDVDRRKFGKMAELAWALDEDYYDLVLMRCDRFSRTRFLPRHASIVHTFENLERDKAEDIVYVDDWHRYTADYCADKIPAQLR